MNIENPDFSHEIAETQRESNISKSVVLIGVLVGLGMNWLTLYLNIVIGLLSVGISAFVVLLFTKILLREKATAQNLTLVSIAYGATSAAEASVGLLFIIWLYNNASSFGFENFEPPSWLLPSPSVLAERLVLTSEWIFPLLVHYFLMLIPGITGLILGIYLAPKFINNEEEFPFPGVIQRVKTVEVLVTNQASKISLFKRFCTLGFIVALITLFYPVIDFSSINNGVLFGIMLGTVGVTMFSVGFIINNPKISIPAGVSSIVLYTFVTPFIINLSDFQDQVAQGMYSNDFFGLYSYLIQDRYLSFLIGFIISVAIISPIVFNRIKAIVKKIRKDNQSLELNDSSGNPEALSSADTKNVSEYVSPEFLKVSLVSRFINLIGKQELGIFSLYVLVLLVSTVFVVSLNVLPGTHVGIVFLLLIWIMFIGALVQGYITTSMIAKASAGSNIPFVFDNLPLFLVGARGLTPYLATPKAEIGETISIVTTLKFGQQMKLKSKHTIFAFLAGYIVAALATPVFALFLWKALGIGNVNFPAPAFPIFLALIGPFAAGAIEIFLNIVELLFGGILALFFPTIGLSVAIGMFFPPHMAICISLGGVTAIMIEKRKGKEWMKDKGQIVATAISVGASLTVPVLILMNLIM
ncbi:MAG: hypothetical protein ACFFAU_04510 [Candidatus Hodarchaeota archaeon]